MKSSKTWTKRTLGGALVAVALGSFALAANFTGAGATFPAPIYTRWAEQYKAASGDQLNYQAIGSGAGVTQILNRTVDFGASDSAVASERLQSQQLLQFPAVIGGVVIAVNIPGVDGNNLKLTGAVVADIYLGRIRMWNDKAIAALNPGVTLPALAIAPVYRSDSSGTTNIFTNYLAAISLPFQTGMGAGNSVAWRTGIGGPGNAGVAGGIRRISSARHPAGSTDAAESFGPVREAQRSRLRRRRLDGELEQRAEYAGQHEQHRWRDQLADRRSDLHPDAQESHRRRLLAAGDEILRLGVQERQAGRRPASLRHAAYRRAGPGPATLVSGEGRGQVRLDRLPLTFIFLGRDDDIPPASFWPPEERPR